MITSIDRKALASFFSIPSEIRGFIYNKQIAAKVLSWDNFTYGTEKQYKPEDVEAVSIQEDIIWFRLDIGAVPISVDQFISYWERIKQSEMEEIKISSEESEEIVNQAKTQGTAIWEHGCKLGYVVHRGGWFYAITEVLTHNKGLQYSHSRHGSFFLAQEELRERSWEVA
jgi:hypothetical protein